MSGDKIVALLAAVFLNLLTSSRHSFPPPPPSYQEASVVCECSCHIDQFFNFLSGVVVGVIISIVILSAGAFVVSRCWLSSSGAGVVAGADQVGSVGGVRGEVDTRARAREELALVRRRRS